MLDGTTLNATTPNATSRGPFALRLRLVGWAWALLGMAVVGLATAIVTVVMLGLSWTWVVLPVLVGAVWATRAMANVHRSWAGRLLGAPIEQPYRPRPPGSWLTALRSAAGDPATWRDLAWLGVNSTVGFTLLVLTVSLAMGGLWQLVFPLVWSLAPGVLADNYGLFRIETLGQAIAVSWPLALVYFGLAWWLTPHLMRADAVMVRWLLAPTERSRLASRVRQLAESRAETVDTQAAELRRIERDLHDGAQARLVALGMSLGMADEVVDSDPAAAKALLAEARSATTQALAELRDLVRGIHPPVLADRGLDGAVRALALASPLPVQVEIDLPGRPPAPVESAAYFAIAEAITNVIKHSGASKAWVRVSYRDGRLATLVADDGRGGARQPVDPSGGTGLRGIESRLAAFDGTVVVSSPSGGPTVVTMELPCVLSSPRTSPSSGTA
jgi:signal transduction histidine kinase